MAGCILLGTLALLGLLCALWGLFGLYFGCGKGSALVCLWGSGREPAQILRYCWLRGMGLIRSPMLILECPLSEPEKARLCGKYPGIQFCTWAELPALLEQERERFG